MIRTSLSACALALVAAACSSGAAVTTLTPVTGILLRGDALVSGHGCGTAPNQVYKYAVVVVNDNDTAVRAGNVYDCFADASFENLPASSEGKEQFTVHVFAFDKAAYDANPAILAHAQAALDTSLAGDKPTFITKCTATQQADIQVLAVCNDPLSPP